MRTLLTLALVACSHATPSQDPRRPASHPADGEATQGAGLEDPQLFEQLAELTTHHLLLEELGETGTDPDLEGRLEAVLGSLGHDGSDATRMELMEIALLTHAPESLPLLERKRDRVGTELSLQRMRRLQELLERRLRDQGHFPSQAEGLEVLLAHGADSKDSLKPIDLTDGWGTQLVYRAGNDDAFELRSAGPDRIHDTPDDLTGDHSGRLEPPESQVPPPASVPEEGGAEPPGGPAKIKLSDFAISGGKIEVQLALASVTAAGDPAEQALTSGRVVLLIDGVASELAALLDHEGRAGFQLEPAWAQARLREGRGTTVLEFSVEGVSAPSDQIWPRLIWTLELADAGIEGTPIDRLEHWADILEDVPPGEAGRDVRAGILTFVEPLMSLDSVIEEGKTPPSLLRAGIGAAGGLDPQSPETQRRCMQLQYELGAALRKQGKHREAARAFGNAVRHASDVDSLDSLDFLLSLQFEESMWEE